MCAKSPCQIDQAFLTGWSLDTFKAILALYSQAKSESIDFEYLVAFCLTYGLGII